MKDTRKWFDAIIICGVKSDRSSSGDVRSVHGGSLIMIRRDGLPGPCGCPLKLLYKL